jgi:hypothetical protein
MAISDESAAAQIAAVDAAVVDVAIARYLETALATLAGAAGAKDIKPPWSVPDPDRTVTAAETIVWLRAAVIEQAAATRVINACVRAARGEGVSWSVIGQALGLEEQAEAQGRPLAEVAYTAVAGDGTGLSREVAFFYTCGSCGQMITDRGPRDVDPAVNESGHAERCVWFRALVGSYKSAYFEWA